MKGASVLADAPEQIIAAKHETRAFVMRDFRDNYISSALAEFTR